MALLKVNQDTYARLFKILLHEVSTAHELAEETGLHVVTVQSLMRTLKKHKVVHVCEWEADRLGRDVTPVYKLGAGKDKPRHKFTARERQARHRARKLREEALTGGKFYAEAEQVQTTPCITEPIGVCA